MSLEGYGAAGTSGTKVAPKCRSNAQLTNEQTVRVIINVLTLFMLFIGINPWDIYRDNHGIILRLVGILGINRDKNIYIYIQFTRIIMGKYVWEEYLPM